MANLDKQIINPFLNAFSEVAFRLLDGEAVKNGLKIANGPSIAETDVAVIIGITGEIIGKVVFIIKHADALQIASLLLRRPVESFDRMVRSALGEMANMVTGRAVTELSHNGFRCDITPPAVLIGENMRVTQVRDEPFLSVDFTTQAGEVELILGLKNMKERNILAD